jgi:beta-1,4-mannosyltransferase
MNIYMFPYNNIERSKNKNPYINDLLDSLKANNVNIINGRKNNKYGIFDLLIKMTKTDIYYLNFIENTPDRKFGFIQTISLIIILLILKISGKKILWVIHNKISHSKNKLLSKIILFYILTNIADKLITHSKEGILFTKSFLKKGKDIKFIHHPIKNNLFINNTYSKKNDILIWGAITPYKGIHSFIDYVIKNKLNDYYNILIIGKISDKELKDKLESIHERNIIIKNQFIENEDLEKLFSETKFVLFTYSGFSTLSSGALMDTLSYGAKVIGPNVGAFKDLKEESLIETYNSFDELFKKIKDPELLTNFNIDKFINDNTWDNFAKKVIQIIKD